MEPSLTNRNSIFKLIEFTDKGLQDYMVGYNDQISQGVLKNPNAKFDDFGLRFDVDYLNRIGVNVIFLPLEIMAEYVDAVTKQMIDNNEMGFEYNQIINPDFDVDQLYETVNATGIGNAAYVCLNSKNEISQKQAEKLLNSLFVKAKDEILKSIGETE